MFSPIKNCFTFIAHKVVSILTHEVTVSVGRGFRS